MGGDAVLGADPGLAVAEHDRNVVAVAARRRAQARGGRGVAQDRQARVVAQQRRGRVGPDGPSSIARSASAFSAPVTRSRTSRAAQQRAQPDGQRLARDAFVPAEVGGGGRDRRRVQRHAVDALARARAPAR